MAKLSAHGIELDRREYATFRVAVMSDGNIMRNYGTGWKLWKRVKPGVDPVQYAKDTRAKYDERMRQYPMAAEYLRVLCAAVSLELRARLHTTVTLMPSDPDGVWSELDTFGGPQVDLEDCLTLCRLWQSVENTAVETQ